MAELTPSRRAAFLDRDGVINVDYGYVHTIERFDFIAGAVAGLKLLQDAGFRLVVVTNQSGIGRGFYDNAAFRTLMAHVTDALASEGILLDGIYYCPHAPEDDLDGSVANGCYCRKPAPGMILDAAADLDIDLARSVMIGDRWSDILAARAAGVGRSYLVGNNGGAEAAHGHFADLLSCATAITAT